MRFAAAFLLIIAFVLDVLAGAGCLVLGLMGADALMNLLSMTGGLAGDYAAVIEREADRAVAGVMALESRLDRIVSELEALGISFGYALAAAGALLVVAGSLGLAAAIRFLERRSGTIVYAGCVAVAVGEAAALALLGFSYLQLPGFLGAVLGLLSTDSLESGVESKPAAKPPATAKPDAAKKPAAAAEPAATAPPAEAHRSGTTTKVRPTVKTAEFPKPPSAKATGRFRRIAASSAAAVLLVAGGLAAYLLVPKYFGHDPADAPTRTAARTPAPAPKPTPSEKPAPAAPGPPAPVTRPKIPSGPVEGRLAGKPFKPERVALKVDTGWTSGGSPTRVAGGTGKGFERLFLTLEAGKDFHIEIDGLPESYDFATGLDLRVTKGPTKSGKPKLTLTHPQGGNTLPKIEFVYDRYELDLKLDPLRGNRINGRISLVLPEYMKTRFAGAFKAWVDGHPDIEPDLTRGGGPTFKYLAFQYLREIHPGSKVTIKDDTYSHQVGDASNLLAGYIMVVYSVDGEELATILRIETSEGYWRVLDSLDATYLAEAHPIEVPDPENEGQWVNYLAARHTEQWFREEYPGKYPWGVRFTGTSNTEMGYADIHLRLKPYGEPDAIERRYYFLRKDGRWRYIRDLKDEEMIDQKTGQVVMKPVAEEPETKEPETKEPETVDHAGNEPATG